MESVMSLPYLKIFSSSQLLWYKGVSAPCSRLAHLSSLAPQWPICLYLALQHLLALPQSTTLSHASQSAQFLSFFALNLFFSFILTLLLFEIFL